MNSLRFEGFTIALLFVLVLLPPTSVTTNVSAPPSSRPTIYSSWAGSTPTIDGKLEAGEYGDPQIVFTVPPYNAAYLNASIYFVNDAQRLYVMVDAIGDQTDSVFDEALLIFGFSTTLLTHSALSTVIGFRGHAGSNCQGPVFTSSKCVLPEGVSAAIGYGESSNSVQAHKMYEASIPLSQLHLSGGQTNFSSPKANVFSSLCGVGKGCDVGSLGYDYATGRDNVWPDGLAVTKVATWGILVIAASPMPEFNQVFAIVLLSVLLPLYILRLGRAKKHSLHK